MDYVNFLKSYGGLIIACLVLVMIIISMIIKKKPLAEIFDNSAYEKIVQYIKEAENKYGPGHGETKLIYVVNRFASTLSADEKSKYENLLYNAVSHIVDDILDTPERKEKKK